MPPLAPIFMTCVYKSRRKDFRQELWVSALAESRISVHSSLSDNTEWLTYAEKPWWTLAQKICAPRLQCGSWSPWRSTCWKFASQPTPLLNYAKTFRRWGLVEWNYIIGVMPSEGTWNPHPFLSPYPPIQSGWATSFTAHFLPWCTTLPQATGPSDRGLTSLTLWAKINLPSSSS